MQTYIEKSHLCGSFFCFYVIIRYIIVNNSKNQEMINMMDKEKFREFNQLETKLHNEWLHLCSDSVDGQIPEDCGVLEVSMKGNDAYVIIFKSDIPSLKRIEVDNKHIWDYIVNELFMDKPKVVHLTRDHSEKEYTPLTFSNELYDKLDAIQNDEGLNTLEKELFEN